MSGDAVFVRTSSIGDAFRLDSVISLRMFEPYSGTWVVHAKLSDGSTVAVASYATQAAAQEAFEFLIDAVGSINPPGSVS